MYKLYMMQSPYNNSCSFQLSQVIHGKHSLVSWCEKSDSFILGFFRGISVGVVIFFCLFWIILLALSLRIWWQGRGSLNTRKKHIASIAHYILQHKTNHSKWKNFPIVTLLNRVPPEKEILSKHNEFFVSKGKE